MGTHRKVVGALHVVMGLFALVPVMILTALFGGIWAIAAVAAQGHGGITVLGIGLATILAIVLASTALAGALGIAAGLGVLFEKKWGDVLATVASALHVFSVPFGTALAVYTVWALWLDDRALARGANVAARQQYRWAG
jgi:hypothetical protein